jgi:hypothetical protein
MRKIVVLVALIGFFAPALANAAPIAVSDQIKVSYGDLHEHPGGEFLINPTAGATFTAFESFCVQLNEHVRPDNSTLYRVAGISTRTMAETDAYEKDLNDGAAWLYEQFILNRLGTFGFTYAAHSDAGEFQRAIWHFMGETGYVLDTTNRTNEFVNYVRDHGPVSSGNVRVLNLQTLDGKDAQDQLVYIEPVPEAGSLGLVLTGLAALLGRMRRRA